MRKAARNRPLRQSEKRFNKQISKRRFRVEQCFGTMKRLFGLHRARYFGVAKTHAQMVMAAISQNLLKAANKITLNQQTQAIAQTKPAKPIRLKSRGGTQKLAQKSINHQIAQSRRGLLPALVAPLVVWPDATGGTLDLPRLIAATTTLLVGYWVKNVLAAVLAGAGTLYLLLSLIG